MSFHWLNATVALAIMGLGFLVVTPGAVMALPPAYVAYGNDPPLPAYFSGTSSPVGNAQINVYGGHPGYLNGISGGLSGGAEGNISIFDVDQETLGGVEFAAIAIHVTDNAGASHSLSALNDPALTGIVNDLNNFVGPYGPVAYAYGSVPQQYAPAITALSLGEAANGGQPFDIFLVQTNTLQFPKPQLEWGFNFSGEIGNLDGITALEVTDVGVIPEPGCGLLVVAGVSFIPGRCHRRRRLGVV